ncbi:heme-binding protein [Derxia gummosa]|uniref:Heme-binding protein n=1 Tax=Derxia gummosa DSM 723 TaxID=1121388 RepID=A0A8B6X3S3_9BURK|nr:heme-binding protein [Derxia gummosa]
MQTKAVLTVSDVDAILAAARAEAIANNWAVSIAVVDDGGHLLGLVRLDNAAALSAYICQEKARTAALGRRESKVYEDMINGGRVSFLSAPVLQGMLEGGVPVVVDGQTVGAVGVSGVKSDQDAQIAKAGIAALG